MAEVRVLLFSILKEKLGTGSVTVTVSPDATVSELLDRLCERYDDVAAFRTVARVAVNCEYATGDYSLKAGDEVALITPVSGG